MTMKAPMTDKQTPQPQLHLAGTDEEAPKGQKAKAHRLTHAEVFTLYDWLRQVPLSPASTFAGLARQAEEELDLPVIPDNVRDGLATHGRKIPSADVGAADVAQLRLDLVTVARALMTLQAGIPQERRNEVAEIIERNSPRSAS